MALSGALIIVNGLLIRYARRSQIKAARSSVTAHSSSDNRITRELQRMALMVTFLTLASCIFTLPRSITLVLFQYEKSQNNYILIKALDSFAMIYHSFSIVIILLANSKFRNEFKLYIPQIQWRPRQESKAVSSIVRH